jgi:hypothetical protein
MLKAIALFRFPRCVMAEWGSSQDARQFSEVLRRAEEAARRISGLNPSIIGATRIVECPVLFEHLHDRDGKELEELIRLPLSPFMFDFVETLRDERKKDPDFLLNSHYLDSPTNVIGYGSSAELVVTESNIQSQPVFQEADIPQEVGRNWLLAAGAAERLFCTAASWREDRRRELVISIVDSESYETANGPLQVLPAVEKGVAAVVADAYVAEQTSPPGPEYPRLSIIQERDPMVLQATTFVYGAAEQLSPGRPYSALPSVIGALAQASTVVALDDLYSGGNWARRTFK